MWVERGGGARAGRDRWDEGLMCAMPLKLRLAMEGLAVRAEPHTVRVKRWM